VKITDFQLYFRRRISLRAARTACFAALGALTLSGCFTFLPTVGPSRHKIANAKAKADAAAIQFINVDDKITSQLAGQRKLHLFSETLGTQHIATSRKVGAGDLLEVTIWEAAPATLFGTPVPGATGIATSHPTSLPDQPIDDDGTIYVPFAGRVPAAGKTLQEISADIVTRLEKKANQPQVFVRMTHNTASNAVIVGEVNLSTRMALVPGSERLLDALAAAGGVRDPINKTTIQLTRAENVYSLPLETIIKDPRQNVSLLPGDVITALFQPFSFTALGASGKNDEINFETQGISLAQAIARSGGLIDSRSNARGVFVFRFEPKGTLDWPRQPVKTTADGLVPTVYRVDMTNPESLFLIQNFPMEDRDVLYVSNAPVTEVQKFLNVLFSVAYPILAAKSAGL
jgi:polysaccharide export outer membrane protein